MAHTLHLTRYFNPSLSPLYAQAAPTPKSGVYVHQKCAMESGWRGMTYTSVYLPTMPLQPSLMANTFQTLTVNRDSELVPERPCYAPWATNSNKRKMNAMVQKKNELIEGHLYRTLKIRLHPSLDQAVVLRQWFAAKRLFYNKAVSLIKAKELAHESINFVTLRIEVRELVFSDHPWTAKINQQVTANATKAAYEAYQTNLAKKRIKPTHRFKMGFQSLRRVDITPTEVVNLGVAGNSSQGLLKGFHHSASTRAVGGSRMDMECRLGGKMPGCIRAHDSEEVVLQLIAKKNVTTEPTILWDKRVRRFYLLVKQVVKRPADTLPPEKRHVLALDPGARKFNSFYRPDGVHGDLLLGADTYMKKMCSKAAHLQSKTDTAANHEAKHHYRGQMLRTFARIRNWSKNSHYKAIKKLFTLGDFIVLPLFETERMSRRAGRVFGNKTAQKLYTWSHYSFGRRLYSKVQTTSNKQIAFTREPGTSKTCDCCGAWNASLGAATVFRCRSCSYTVDRDHHGARGNLLSALGAALGVGPDGVER